MPTQTLHKKMLPAGKKYRVAQNIGDKSIKTAFSGKKSRALKLVLRFFSMAGGFFLGGARLPFGVYPCGTALVCAGKERLFAYIGASLSCLCYERFSVAYFCINTLAFFLTSLFFKGKEGKKEKIILSSALSVFCGFVMCATGGFELQYVAAGASYAAFLPISTLCLCGLPRKIAHGTVDGLFCGAVFLVAFSLSEMFVGVLYPGLLFSVFAVLFCASNGCVYGLLTGLLCGTALSGGELAIPFGIAGATAGVFYEKRREAALPACAFAVSFCASEFYFSHTEMQKYIVSALCAAALYIPASLIIPKAAQIALPSPVAEGLTSRWFAKLSCALSSVSDMVYNVSDKLRYPTENEVREMAEDTFSELCGKCPKKGTCSAEKLYQKLDVAGCVSRALLSGGVSVSDFPERFSDGCISLRTLTERLNEVYREVINERFLSDKTEILASEYSTMARLIKYTSNKAKEDILPDKVLEQKAHRALCSAGVRFSTVRAYGTREKVIEVSGVSLRNFPCTSSALAALVSEHCGYIFGEPEFSSVSDTGTVTFRRKRKLSLEYSKSACAKGGGNVCGDTASFFESDNHYFYALISDGMGSGRSAALTSRLTSVFIEKLLTSGTHKSATLELLNNLLLSKNDESFATVDLLEVDLLTGEASFVKAGAAPAYVIRASKLYKIASCTPPAGIVRSFSAENTKFSLERGDTVLMLSDGIVQSSDEVPWLCEMMSCGAEISPSELCEKILYKARKFNLRDDDMTCVAVKVV